MPYQGILEGFCDFEIRAEIIGTAKNTDGRVLLFRKEPVLECMVHRISETGR